MVNARRPAREHQRARPRLPKLRDVDPGRDNLTVDVRLPDTPGDELSELRPEVDDDDPLGDAHEATSRSSSSVALQ